MHKTSQEVVNEIWEKGLHRRGVELAQSVQWNGADILRIAIEALTDANFHTEACELEKILTNF